MFPSTGHTQCRLRGYVLSTCCVPRRKGEVKHREVKMLTPGHSASEWQSGGHAGPGLAWLPPPELLCHSPSRSLGLKGVSLASGAWTVTLLVAQRLCPCLSWRGRGSQRAQLAPALRVLGLSQAFRSAPPCGLSTEAQGRHSPSGRRPSRD